MTRIQVGDYILPRKLETICASFVDVPSQYVTHLQFRRFSSCPICRLHLDTFVERHLDLVENGIQEVVVFHSSLEEMLKHGSEIPFAMIADPGKALYKAFGIESSLCSVINPLAWMAGLKGIMKLKRVPYEKDQTYFGLPADLLIARSGEVVAVKYGKHANDHWQVDDVITFARQLAV